jgi:hypothetical protein
MKKKTIILVNCVLLLLLLTSWSYGGPDPRHARFLGHPWEELKSPPHPQDNSEIVLKSRGVVVIIPITAHCFIYTKSVNASQSSKGEYIDPQPLKK